MVGRRKWLVLVAMTGSLSMILLDQTVVTVALPSMQAEIPLSPGGVHWVVSAYLLAMASVVALGGRLGDRFGSVTMFRAGVVVFFLASAGCGLAPIGTLGEPVLLFCRGAQGVGAALMMPATESVIVSAFPIGERGRAMAVYVGVGQIFLAIGPLLGGLLTELISWRAVFWLNVPVGIAALVLVAIARPEDERDRTTRISLVPVVALVAGMGLLVFGLQQGPVIGWDTAFTSGAVVLGAVGLTAFARAQSRSAHPLVDVRLFRAPGLGGDLLVLGMVQFALLAMVLYSSLYLQDVLTLSPIATGFAALPFIIAVAVGAQVGGRWFDRAGVRAPVLTGLALAAAGTTAWSVSLTTLSYGWQLPGLVVTGIGLGLVQSPVITDALSRIGRHVRSQASGLVQTVRQVGGALGVAVIGGVVLSAEPAGSAAGVDSAPAIAVGFAVAAATLTIALVAGARALSRHRISDAVP